MPRRSTCQSLRIRLVKPRLKCPLFLAAAGGQNGFQSKRKSCGGKVENLPLVFHFSTALIVRAVGMWESRAFCEIPKECGKRGNPAFGFPRFPHSVISTALSFPHAARDRRGRISR